MVLQSLMGSAFSYANAAYSYNLGRYKFDSGQSQTYELQLMNFRLALWGLFREDVRDLFTLTTNHMSNYMMMGSLFLGFAMNNIWSGIKDFPMSPPWVMLMWGNCFVSSIAYGTMCVWLAMHGSITAHSLSVRMLAQLVRPPIPSAEALRAVQGEQSQHEASGSVHLFRPPDFLRLRNRGGGAAEQEAGSAPSVRAQESTAPAAARQPLEAYELTDSLGSLDAPSRSGPGRSAALESHFRVFQRAQASFLSFDAYARVCLAGCVSQLLLSLAYSIISHDQQRGASSAAKLSTGAFSWESTGMIVFASLCLFKLDLYVEQRRLRNFKCLIVMGPLALTGAVQLWLHGRFMHAVFLLVLLAALLHIAWLVLFLVEAAPAGPCKLPTNFRSVRYLDVFGQATDESGEKVPQEFDNEALLQVWGLEEALKLMLRQDFSSEHLSQPEVEQLRELQRLFARKRVGTPAREQSTSFGTTGWWLQRVRMGDNQRTLPYFVNPWTSEVLWHAPDGACIVVLSELLAKVHELQGWALSSQPSSRQLQDSLQAPSFQESDTVGLEYRSEGTAQRRPGSSYDQASMPWKYFMQLTCSMILVWVGTIAYCILDHKFLLMPRTLVTTAERVEFKVWPHEFFAPRVLACSGKHFFLGDHSEVYSAALPSAPPSAQAPWQLALEPVLQAEDLPAPWDALATVRRGSALLLLERGGHTAWEISLPRGPAQRWPLGASLGTPLRSFESIEGRAAVALCNSSTEAPLALLATTVSGEAIGLCARAGRLEPTRRVARGAEELRALHLDARGSLWQLLAGDDVTALESAALSHALPAGRRWARGVCELASGGLVLAAEAEGPELWHVPAVVGVGRGAEALDTQGNGAQAVI